MGRGVIEVGKARLLREKYGATLEFQLGVGWEVAGKRKPVLGKGGGIFSGTTHCKIVVHLKGALSLGFLLFLVQFCQNYCLLPVIVEKKCSYRIKQKNSSEILVGQANHHDNNFVGDFSMHRVKF